MFLGVVALIAGHAPAVRAQVWETMPEMPTAVAAPAASIQGRSAVVTGGVVLGSSASDAVQVFDLDGLTWTQTTQLHTPRYQHAQVTLNDGRVLIIGGRTRKPSERPVSTSRCELISADLLSCGPTADLPAAMRSPTAHLLADGRVVAVGNELAAVFEPGAQQWRPIAALNRMRKEHASVLLADGTVLVGGGINRFGFERIDIDKGNSELLRVRLPKALDDLAMVLLDDGRVWLIAGQTLGGETTDRTWLLTLGPGNTGTLAEGPGLGWPAGVADHVVMRSAGGIVVAGGESEHHLADKELAKAFVLDPVRLRVHALPDLEIAHDDAAGFEDRGWVYVAGGQVRSSLLGMPVPTPIRAVHRIRLLAY